MAMLLISTEKVKVVANALKGCKSAVNYFSTGKMVAMRNGTQSGFQMRYAFTRMMRAMRRKGQRKPPMHFEATTLSRPKPQLLALPRETLLVGANFLLRTKELLALGKKDVSLLHEGKDLLCSVFMRKSKTDTNGHGCRRTLICMCGKAPGACGGHAMQDLLSQTGLHAHAQVVRNIDGSETTYDDVLKEMRSMEREGCLRPLRGETPGTCGCHSMRRSGTAFWLNFMAKDSVRVFGRWSSDAMDAYYSEYRANSPEVMINLKVPSGNLLKNKARPQLKLMTVKKKDFAHDGREHCRLAGTM